MIASCSLRLPDRTWRPLWDHLAKPIDSSTHEALIRLERPFVDQKCVLDADVLDGPTAGLMRIHSVQLFEHFHALSHLAEYRVPLEQGGKLIICERNEERGCVQIRP